MSAQPAYQLKTPKSQVRPLHLKRPAPFFTPSLQKKDTHYEDPDRYEQTHTNLFVSTPGGGLPWVEPASSKLIIKQFKKRFPRPKKFFIPENTTESEAESDALVANKRILKRFPEIPAPASVSRIKDAVQIMDDTLFSEEDYRRQWLANQMLMHSDLKKFDIKESDARFKAMQDKLFADPDLKEHLEFGMRIVSAFARGDTPASREIHLNKGISPVKRKLTLIHEIVHFYAHEKYREWINASKSPRFYNEGLTEFLARMVMTKDELAVGTKGERKSYQDRVDAVKKDILAYVPKADIRRAFLRGEVWRIEHKSDVAKRIFGEQTGMQADASRKDEIAQAAGAEGIFQQVNSRHFRFMNLAVGSHEPKPKHVSIFKKIKSKLLDKRPELGARFIGHASSTGPSWINKKIAKDRAKAFYAMASAEGVPDARLINKAAPESHGEDKPNTDNESVIGRAFNRRVELLLEKTGS